MSGSRIIDMHFDLPLALQLGSAGELAEEFVPQFDAGDVGIIGAAIYVEDDYLPDRAREVALEQVALLATEIAATPRCAFCRSYAQIIRALKENRIGILLTMEGAEPIGTELEALHRFYRLGLRALSLTHARPNAAASGGIFARSGSPSAGLTTFGRELVRESEQLGIVIDLAHINSAGFEEICALTSKPLIVSHTNARHFHDIERNISDEQIKMIGARDGVIGINSILVSPDKAEATLDRYVDHIEHVAGLIGIDGVGIGFDFCEIFWRRMAMAARPQYSHRLSGPHFIPELSHHGHAGNVASRLSRRGFSEEQIAKLLQGNWLRALEKCLAG